MLFKSLAIATAFPLASARIYLDGEESKSIQNLDGPAIATMSLLPDDTPQQPTSGGEGPAISNMMLDLDGSSGEEAGIADSASVDETIVAESPATATTTEEEVQSSIYKSDIIGPTWTALRYAPQAGEDLVKTVKTANGTTITLEFEQDGSFDGFGGCNSYRGTAEHDLDAPTFSVGPVISTLKFCEGAVGEQESMYLALFQPGTMSWTLSDDKNDLKLSDVEGNVLVEYTLFEPVIVDETWTVISYRNEASGEELSVLDTDMTLRIETNERFDGFAGCNNYIGQYDDLTSTSFTVTSVVGATRKMCGDQARLATATSIMEQEATYLGIFREGRVLDWAVSEDGALELRDGEDGTKLVTYEAGLSADKDELSAAEDSQDELSAAEDSQDELPYELLSGEESSSAALRSIIATALAIAATFLV